MIGRASLAERWRRAIAAFVAVDSESAGATDPQPPDDTPALAASPEATGPPASPTDAALPVALDQIIAQSWQSWLRRVSAQLQSPAQMPEPSDYESVLLAVLHLPPGAMFRANINQMLLAEWNAMAIAGMPYPGWTRASPQRRRTRAPNWALILALHRLGFDAAAMRGLIADKEEPDCAALTARLMQSAPIGRPGLLILEDAPNYVDLAVSAAPIPVLVMPAGGWEPYGEVLTILRRADAFRGVVGEAPQLVASTLELPAIPVPRDPARAHMVAELAERTMKS